MSFLNPVKAIPISIYSNKATFVTERDVSGASVADTYTLRIREFGTTTWTNYEFPSSVLYAFIDPLKPYTQYETQWSLTKTGSTNNSAIHSFYTRYNERFQQRPAIPSPLYGDDFPNALQAELDAHIDYINTLDDERAIERYLKEGAGRIEGAGCTFLLSGPQTLSITNGWFQCGSGLPTSDPRWFPGARMFQIASTTGSKEIVVSGSDVLDGDGKFFGYMGAYTNLDGTPNIDIDWIKVEDGGAIPVASNGRWLIGSITVLSGIITEVNDTIAMIISTLKSLRQLISSLSLGGGNNPGGGDNTGGGGTPGPSDADKLKFSPTDINVPPESTYAAVNRIQDTMKEYVDSKFKALQPGQQTSLEFFISQFARSLPGWGVDNPAGLLRIDAAIILAEQYGQAGLTLELNGETIPSPVFEGAGNLTYSQSSKLWEV